MISRIFSVCFLIFVFCLSGFAQNLTVRDIMREPSIAGMRPDSEKLSPDGKLAVFLWNAEGIEPRDLYIVSTNGGRPRRLLSPNLLLQRKFAKNDKPNELNYGLVVKDDFAKARENQISILDWSPDSKKLLLGQNGDLFLLEVSGIENISLTKEAVITTGETRWREVENLIQQRVALIPSIVQNMQSLSVRENEIFGRIAEARAQLLSLLNQTPENAGKLKTETQRKAILQSNEKFAEAVNSLYVLPENYPTVRSSETLTNLIKQLIGLQSSIAVTQSRYELATGDAPSTLYGLIRTQATEFNARFLNDSQILFQQNGNLFIINTNSLYLVQISREANPQTFQSISNVTVTASGSLVAYVVSDGSKQRALFVPNYLDEYVQAPTLRRGFTDQKIFLNQTNDESSGSTEVKLPKAEGASYIRSLRFLPESLLIDRVDRDLKRRQIYLAKIDQDNKSEVTLLDEEIDEKWIGNLSRTIEWNPANPNQFFFTSERDGWNHIYLATINFSSSERVPKAEIKQLTKGNYEIDWAKWSANGAKIVYSSTEKNTATREFYVFDFQNNKKYQISSNNVGMKTTPQLSTKGSEDVLLYEFSSWKAPSELYSQKICLECSELNLPNRLTDSIPARFSQRKWNDPQFVDIPSRDGKQIKSKIYLPANFDKSKKYPMVFFVHGAGYLQNTINGWNNYYREFMFNQLLTQKGYVVLDIDYRGSMGYGRDWRTDVYDFLGGKDYEDHLDAIDFAVKNYSVDANKIGVYGGSYGGFMAEMLVMRAPEKIAAAAALRPVADWKNYFASSSIYTVERLGFPDKNPEAYKRSSPISYAENLRKPLLILHGVVDDNVPAQDSMQLVEKLIRLEKTQYFEAMFFPSENHGFQRPTSWTDEYQRILTFFEKHLK